MSKTRTAELEQERDYQRDQAEKLGAAADAAIERLRSAKNDLARISALGRQRQYADPAVYESAVQAVQDAQMDHQRCLKASGRAKRAMNEAHQKLLAIPESRDGGRKLVFAQHFVRVAKSLLPPETFAIISESAERAEAMSEDGKARELTGKVLPALGSVGGMRERP